MRYTLEELGARRAAERQAQRRRRRRRAGGAVAAAVLIAGVLVGLYLHAGGRPRALAAGRLALASRGPVGGRGHSPLGGTRSRSRRSTPGDAAGPGARPAFPLSPDRLQVAAVRRLAALGHPLFCGARKRRVVALTFDDGPGPYTLLAIRKLRQAHAVATFFLVGREIGDWAGEAPRERAVAAFGDHTMSHPYLPALGSARMIAEVTDARALIERTVHEPVVLFRPPYGAHSATLDSAIRALGLLEVMWSVDSADSLGADYAGIERNVVAGLHPGAIILMHENHGQTIRALPVILQAIAHRHLRTVTIPQLVSEDPPTPAQLSSPGGGCATRLGGSGG